MGTNIFKSAIKNTSSARPFALKIDFFSLSLSFFDTNATTIGTHILFTSCPTAIFIAILDCYQLEIYSYSKELKYMIASCMPRFTNVMTIDMLTDTYIVLLSWSIDEKPMLIPRDIRIKTVVAPHAKILLSVLCPLGNPIFYHFIYSGYGALDIFTYFIGKSLYLKYFQNLRMEIGALFS